MISHERFHWTSILDHSQHAIGDAMSRLHFSHLVLDIICIVVYFHFSCPTESHLPRHSPCCSAVFFSTWMVRFRTHRLCTKRRKLGKLNSMWESLRCFACRGPMWSFLGAKHPECVPHVECATCANFYLSSDISFLRATLSCTLQAL